MNKLTNNPELKFKSIEGELYREYVFPNGDKVRIEEPMQLNVSPSGGHRVLDKAGKSWYIAPKWVCFYWEVPDDRPHFYF